MHKIGLAVFCAAVSLISIGCILNVLWLRTAEASRRARMRREVLEEHRVSIMEADQAIKVHVSHKDDAFP